LAGAYSMMEAIAETRVESNPDWVQYASTVLSMGRVIVNVARSTTPVGVVSQLAQAAMTAAIPSILRAANSNIPGVMTGLRTAASIAMVSIGLTGGNAHAGLPTGVLRTPSGSQALSALMATILRVAEAYAPIPRGPGRASPAHTAAVRSVARSASRSDAPVAGMSRAQQDALAAGWIFDRPSTCLDRVVNGPSAAPYGTITNALRSGSGAIVTDGRGNPILVGCELPRQVGAIQSPHARALSRRSHDSQRSVDAIVDLVAASRASVSTSTEVARRESESQTALGIGIFSSAITTLERSAAEGSAITSFYARTMEGSRTASNHAVASLTAYAGPTLNWSGRSGTYGHVRSENSAGVTTSWFESSGWGSAMFSRSNFKATERSKGSGSSRDRRR
ncbi:MAG: hypothetical protein NTV32_05740, partial [Gammaproteobacteria bacterium]|nr:hypothetical protein [Gammaproteobacteria bacterium]